MRIPYEKESVLIPEWRGNTTLPPAEQVRVHLRWPTVLEDSAIPELEFVDQPVKELELVDGKPTGRVLDVMVDEIVDGAATGNKVAKTQRIASEKSLAQFIDHVMRVHATKIDNLEGIATGADLADAPIDIFGGLVWAIALSFRAGPHELLEKKTD